MILFIALFLQTFSTGHFTFSNPTKIQKDFYTRAVATVQNNQIAVYDAGNKKVHLYDNKLNEILSFGKEGNGPGEFSGQEHTIFMNQDRIFVFSFNKVHLFDKKGNHVKSIRNWSEPTIEVKPTKNGIFFFSSFMPNRKELQKTIDNDGNVIKSVQNPIYKEKFEENMGYGNIVKTKNGFALFKKDKYNVTIYDEQFKKITKKIVRPFERFKADAEYFKLKGNVPESELPQALSYMMQLSGGFKSDVKHLETYKDYIIAFTETESRNKLSFDIIDKSYNIIGSQSIEFKDRLQSYKFVEDKLVFSFRNDDIGPYIKIYDVSMN